MDRVSILIVEDNPGDVLLIREYLAEMQRYPHDIREAGALESALGLLGHYHFDVVLLDLSLPDSSGLDTVRRLIAKFPEVAVIVLTGLQDEDIALRSVRYGAQDYLEKQQLSPGMLYKSILYSIERKLALQEKGELLSDLTSALKQIQSLEGMLPVCVCCKKIRAENDQWLRIEEYLSRYSGVGATRLVCPTCKNALENEFDSWNVQSM
jgi:DNA-binding NarL/FixJ family response regulator